MEAGVEARGDSIRHCPVHSGVPNQQTGGRTVASEEYIESILLHNNINDTL